MLPVDVDRQLVTEVALAVLLGPGGVHVLLAPLCRAPRGRHCALFDQFLLAATILLPGRRHQRCVDDLTTTRDETLLEQLFRDPIEKGFCTCFTNPVLEGPHGGAIRHVRGVRQPAEALVAHAVEQLVLHLLIGEVVQALEDQNPHNRLSRVRRSATLSAHRPRRHPIKLSGQRRKVDVRFDLGQRIAQRVNLAPMMLVGKQIRLDGASSFHRCRLPLSSGPHNFTKGGRGEVFRGARLCAVKEKRA